MDDKVRFENLKIEGDLPYLGIVQEDGSLKINEHIKLNAHDWDRPDYDGFISGIPQTEFECANIITGIADIDSVKQIVEKLEQEFLTKEKISYPKSLKNPKGFAFFDFACLMSDIREAIDLGVKTGILTKIDINDKDDIDISSYAGSFFFNPYIHYDVWQFLKFMQLYSFPIPYELQFQKNAAGELEWCNNETAPANIKPPEDSFDSFVKSLTFSFENDAEINIQLPKKPKTPVTAQTLGFKNSRGKTFKSFVDILKEPPSHYYHLEASNKDASKKRLLKLNDKLKNYLVTLYKVEPPSNYRLYELVKEAEPGTYCFKFKIDYPDTYDECALDRLQSAIAKYKKTPTEENQKNLISIAKKCHQNGELTRAEFEEILENAK